MKRVREVLKVRPLCIMLTDLREARYEPEVNDSQHKRVLDVHPGVLRPGSNLVACAIEWAEIRSSIGLQKFLLLL